MEKCICQLLMGHGLLSDDALHEYLAVLVHNPSMAPNGRTGGSARSGSSSSSSSNSNRSTLLPLNEYFASINRKIRKLSLEIKSVRQIARSGKGNLLHGIVNIEEDAVAKKWGKCSLRPSIFTNTNAGSKFDELGTKIFGIVARQLLTNTSMTTAELISAVKDDPSMAGAAAAGREETRISDLLKEMCADKWLSRNDRNLWELGPRSYLELSSYFQVNIAYLIMR